MKHLNEGEIKAYLDHELASDTQRIEAHLDICPDCQAQADALRLQAAQVARRLSSLTPDKLPASVNYAKAHARFAARLSKDSTTQLSRKKIFSNNPRPAWIGILAVFVLATVLAFPQVRVIANNFLGLFRVEQIRVVQIDPMDLPEQLGASSQFEQIMAQNVNFEGGGEAQKAIDGEDASRMAGFTVRLPELLEDIPQLHVQPGGTTIYQIDLDLVQALLAELDRSDIQLPADLQGATVKVEIEAIVIAQYGDCDIDKEKLQKSAQEGYDPDHPNTPFPATCTTLMQTRNPSITAPAGLDIAQIGEAYLQVLGMSRDEASRFARNVDWTSTFVIPIPGSNSNYKEVQVDGVTGTLITMPGKVYYLLWLKDGILYALHGQGETSLAAKIGNSLK